MKQILRIIVVIFALIVFSLIGFGIRSVILDKKIKALDVEYSKKQAIADNMAAEINAKDSVSEQDKVFFDTMFSEIFTFGNISEFRDAKANAKSYNLSEDFVERLYDTSEYSQSAYAESMLSVMCQYDSAKLYLLGRENGTGYYVADVTLKTVKYSSDFHLILFVVLADSGDLNQRVKSIVYYNAG